LRGQKIHTVSGSLFEISLKSGRNPIEKRRKEERLDVKPIMRDENFWNLQTGRPTWCPASEAWAQKVF